MNDALTLIAALRRPRLLVRAARHGLVDYSRERDLKRLIGPALSGTPELVVRRLLSEEERMETIRCDGDMDYSLPRHVDLLIALMAEARLLPREAGP